MSMNFYENIKRKAILKEKFYLVFFMKTVNILSWRFICKSVRFLNMINKFLQWKKKYFERKNKKNIFFGKSGLHDYTKKFFFKVRLVIKKSFGENPFSLCTDSLVGQENASICSSCFCVRKEYRDILRKIVSSQMWIAVGHSISAFLKFLDEWVKFTVKRS